MSIKIQLKKRGYNITEIAKTLNITQQALSAQLSNDTLPVRRLRDIAAVVDCTAADLLADDEAGPGVVTPGSDNFAALISYQGRNYTPATLDELQQLVEQLAADRAAGTDAARAAPADPPRRRRVPSATSDN